MTVLVKLLPVGVQKKRKKYLESVSTSNKSDKEGGETIISNKKIEFLFCLMDVCPVNFVS